MGQFFSGGCEKSFKFLAWGLMRVPKTKKAATSLIIVAIIGNVKVIY